MGRPRKNAKATAGQKRKADALYEDSGWIIECPGKPDSAQPRGVTDIFKDNDNPGVEELAIDFSIRPGSKWSSIKGYTNVKCELVKFISFSTFADLRRPGPDLLTSGLHLC